MATAALSLGRNWDYVSRILKTYNIAFWILAAVAVAGWGVWRLTRRKRSENPK